MMEGVKEQAIDGGLVTEDEWGKGIAAPSRSADSDGAFCYTFFKAFGKRPQQTFSGFDQQKGHGQLTVPLMVFW